MITYILRHDGVDLGTIVQESHTTLPIHPHSSYILDPMPSLKGVQIQEGSLWSGFYASRASVRELFTPLVIVRGVWGSLCWCHPSLPFNCFCLLEVFTSRQLWMKCSGVLQVVAAFLICLGILYSPCQAYHKLFCNSFNSTRIVTLLSFVIDSILFFEMLQMYSRLFQKGLVAFEFPQGEETSSPWFGRIISSLSSRASGQLYRVFILGLLGSP